MPLLPALLDLVFAPVCLGCDATILPADPLRLLCGRCRTRLRRVPAPRCERCDAALLRTGREGSAACMECVEWPPELTRARTAFVLQPPADRLVHQVKYRGWRALAGPMGQVMARALEDARTDLADARFVVPVPTSAARIRQRGYNQAGELAAAFARATGRTLLPALARSASSGTQTALQPAARRANVAGAFQVSPGVADRMRGEHLLLVDDVLTTGATVGECARTLASMGARAVSALTFARAVTARRLLER